MYYIYISYICIIYVYIHYIYIYTHSYCSIYIYIHTSNHHTYPMSSCQHGFRGRTGRGGLGGHAADDAGALTGAGATGGGLATTSQW